MLSGPYYCNELSIKTYLLVPSRLFRDLLTLLSQDVDTFLPKSGNHRTQLVGGLFSHQKARYQAQTQGRRFEQDTPSFDLWTSPNRLTRAL
jgi:hypothetical protein